MTTGERIQQARKRAGLSQKELGEKLGVSASMIGQWENNLRNPKTETLLKIADALRVGIAVLAPEDIASAYDAGFNAVIHTRRYRDAKNNKDAQDAEDDAISLILYFNDLDEYEQKQAILFLEALSGRYHIYKTAQPIQKLIISFYELSHVGKKEAIKRVEELTEIPRYRRPESPPPAPAGTDTPAGEKPAEGA